MLQIKNDKKYEYVDQKSYEALGDDQFKYIEDRMMMDYG